MNHDLHPDVLDDLLLAAGGRTLTSEAKARLAALHWALVSRPLLFQALTPGQFIVGDPQAPMVVTCGIIAAAGTQLALANPGRPDLVRASDFAEPGVANADISVRSGIKRFAEYLEANGQRSIASEVRKVRVVGGYLVAPGRRHLDLITD